MPSHMSQIPSPSRWPSLSFAGDHPHDDDDDDAGRTEDGLDILRDGPLGGIHMGARGGGDLHLDEMDREFR